MHLIDFDDPTLKAAVQGRAASLRWRVSLAIAFALGAALTLNSWTIGVFWYVAMVASMVFDTMLCRRYVAATTENARRFYGAAALIATAVTVLIYVGLAAYLGVEGGANGRLLSLMMAGSSLAAAALFLHHALLFSAITVAPSIAWLLAAPFTPYNTGDAHPVASAIGAGLGVAAFIAYAVRASITNKLMMAKFESAMALARRRQADAEEKRAEAEQASRAKTEFMTTMTHELRTPLNAVIGYSEIIAEDLESEGRDELVADAHRISAAARHLLGLIDQVLRLSSAEGARETLNCAPVDVGALVGSIANMLREEAEAKRNRLQIRVEDNAACVVTDIEKLRLCLNQLAANAVKFTTNGKIAITAMRTREEGRDWLNVEIADTGIGMSADHLGKAFLPFTQIDGSITRVSGGLGLGLPIAQRAARALGGEITVESTLGKGSTFILRVPIDPQGELTAMERAA